MSGATWVEALAQAASWICLFAILAIGRQQLERWLIARFQRRQRGGGTATVLSTVRTRDPSPGKAVTRALAMIVALLAGAAIPLAPEVEVGGWRLPFHVFGEANAALLYVLAMEWISAGLLALSERSSDSRPGRAAFWDLGGTLLLSVLQIALIGVSLAMTIGAFHVRRESSLSMVNLTDLQGGWSGLRWFGVFQPLALLLWLACAAPLRPGAQTRTTFAWQVQALNRALLTSTLFFGGWQGPFVEQLAWLGLLYTAVKVGIVTSVWAWAWSSLPSPNLVTRARTVWRVLVPLAALNLVLTAIVVVI